MKRRQNWRYRAACIVSAAVMTAAGLQLSASAEAFGDVNRDDQLDPKDARQLAVWLTEGSGSPDGNAADINADGILNAADLTLLKRMIPEAEPDPVYIHLKDSGITYEGGRISVSGKTAQISQSGVYYIDGSISGGQVLVNIPDEAADAGTVKLFLNGVSMTNTDAPCIMIENAEKTSVNLEEGKENILSDGKEAPADEVEPAFAVLHAKDDLTIKGSGSLEITAGIAYGIHCNNDLKINGGNLHITTENGDAVRGRTSLTVKDGDLFIDSKGDGLKSTKGTLDITGGNV